MPSRDPLILAFRSGDTGWQLVDNDNDTIRKYTTSIFFTSWSRVIVVCWVLAILPAVPLMFNSTIWEKWENKTNYYCYYCYYYYCYYYYYYYYYLNKLVKLHITTMVNYSSIIIIFLKYDTMFHMFVAQLVTVGHYF